MYYLKNNEGQIVRAINWSGEELIVIYRHDTRRIECCDDTSKYDEAKVSYSVIDRIEKSSFDQATKPRQIQHARHLSLVHSTKHDQVLANVELPYDDDKQFEVIAKKTTVGAVIAAVAIFGLSLIIIPKVQKEEPLQVVQVMDRKQIEKMIVVPVAPTKVPMQKRPMTKVVRAVQKTKAPTVAKSSGVLGILGSLKSSKQQGGLNLNNVNASAGIGRGGTQGSGGIQTNVYSKGMFSAPLGTGGKVNGGGGYGTKGKGGGQAGYGQVSLVGAGQGFFQPVESEAWVGGGLDRNEIAAVIQRHISEVRFCYEQGLQQKPKLAGRLSMDFMIGPNGTVSVAKVMNSSLDHVPVENCIRNRLKTWNFPKPEGGVTVKVNYPFILRRVSDS